MDMVDIELPAGAERIISRLQDAGYEAYIVGGCVRDALLHKEPKDWDICTSALPAEIRNAFYDDPDFRILATGEKHGTLTVIVDGKSYEVTTYRSDGEYLDGRHPSTVKFVGSLEADLARRDFAINAMAFGKEQGLIDPYHGYHDLQFGLLRCVGRPEDRFTEDGLRIFRALRFASTYQLAVEAETARGIHECKSRLKDISAERIRVELDKMLLGDGVKDVLLQYKDIIATVIPELSKTFDFDQRNDRWHCESDFSSRASGARG